MSIFRPGLFRWRWHAAGLGLAAALAVLVARFWHPYHGFTRFVQLDEFDARNGIHEVREQPFFVYPGTGGYDGAAYAQIAFHPLLDAPDLPAAVDSLAYRARRILASALAWLAAGGRAAWITHTYAGLNLVVWPVFAWLVWRILPVTDARSWCVWAGVVCSAGALHSVRLALTDLLATTLLTVGVWLGERRRGRGALAAVAAAGLARETALAAVVGLGREALHHPRAWPRFALRAVLVALPLAAWMLYVRSRTGPAAQGFGNFTWPVVGWIEKWADTCAEFVRHPEFTWLITTTLLATLALTVQAVYVLRRARWTDAWWRVGAVWSVMLLLLGTAVWEGHPGAATRVLLPLSVAFGVLAVRERAGWGWIGLGGLSALSGVLALWHVPPAPRELAAGRNAFGAYVARVDTGWHDLERRGSAVWAWTGSSGALEVETFPRTSAPRQIRLKLRAITPREVEVRSGETVLFRGPVAGPAAWIELSAVAPATAGRIRLELRSAAAPEKENAQPGARALGFALYGVEVK